MAILEKQKRVKILFVVQGSSECAADYGKRLEKIVDDICNSTQRIINVPVLLPTSAHDGRMTTLIQWHVYQRRKPKKKASTKSKK